MLPEDQKRLEREADIAKAVRGPDYSELEASIARNKAAADQAQHAQEQENQRAKIAIARLKALYDSVYVPTNGAEPRRIQRGNVPSR